MVIQEQDLDILQWGLRLLDGDPVYTSGYYGDTVQHDAHGIYHQHYTRDHYDIECSHEDPHALHQEFSQLAITDASGYSHAEADHLQPSFHANEWLNQSTENCCSGHECGLPEVGDMGRSSSCSSSDDVEEYSYSLELSDEYVTDGEVCERLNQMIPIPHVPKINGEMPSTDEVTSDYQRLLDRLQLYDFTEHKVQGDGNCQFLALSDQLYRSPEHHKFVRRQVVKQANNYGLTREAGCFYQLKSHPDMYEGYVPMAYNDYLNDMSRSGEWGDHVTLQAAADLYGVKIFVITSFKDTCYIEILPNTEKSKRVIFLSFWAEVHYNSIYPQGDTSSYESRKKKKWWMFGNKRE